MNKKLIYIANARIPTEKAHGIQIMKMCEAFADAGAEVELVLPWRFNNIKQNPFEYYGVKKNFKITKIPSLDMIGFGRIGFWIQALSFAHSSFWYVLMKKADIIYSRDELPLFYFSFFKKNLFWETHTPKKNFLTSRALKKCAGIVTITQGLKDFYMKNCEAGAENILVAPDAVDIQKFRIEVPKKDMRKKLDLPLYKKIILYTGHLYTWKGVGALIDSAIFLDEDVLIYLVGGTDKDIKDYASKIKGCKNIILAGHRPYKEVPFWLKAADILVLPNSAQSDIPKSYTSPMKLFEYMASGTPVVSSDLPSIREILNENNSLLVPPDNPRALAEGITRLLRNPALADSMARRALEDVRNYTWDKRAERILGFVAEK